MINKFLLVAAVTLSSVAAYYSVAGLAMIFVGATTSVIVMGGALEFSKLVIASWLYSNWSVTPRSLRAYFVSATLALMTLTSIGIFGYLSRAHIEHSSISGDAQARLEQLDEQLRVHRATVEQSRKSLEQLDAQVDSMLSRSTTETGATRSARLRKSQEPERKQLSSAISEAQSSISKLNTERAPIASETRKIEAEVGPLKYIAQMIYGDSVDSNILEKSVRLLILLIVFAFDPLAVLMFIAYNQSTKSNSEQLIRTTDQSAYIRFNGGDSIQDIVTAADSIEISTINTHTGVGIRYV